MTCLGFFFFFFFLVLVHTFFHPVGSKNCIATAVVGRETSLCTGIAAQTAKLNHLRQVGLDTINSFRAVAGKHRLHSVASLVVFGTYKYHV